MTARRTLNVLVLAVGGNVSQGILKALRTTTVSCRVVGADVSPYQFGLYTTDAAHVSPWANTPEFLPWLVATCHAEEIDCILSGAEPILAVLAQEHDRISEHTGAVVVVSSQDVEEIGADKLRTCEWLEEHGFAVPAYANAADSRAVKTLRERCGFPLIAKPRIGGGARGLFQIDNDDDLAYAARKQNYILQEIVGTAAREFTVGVFVDRTGDVAGAITMRRELHAGTTYRAFVEDAPEMRRVASDIARALKPRGPCNIQLRETERGPVCFEINPRFSGTTPLRAHFGFNEVDAALRHFVLGEDAIALPNVTSGVCLRYWNELYLHPGAQVILEREGMLKDAATLRSVVEPYGYH